MAGHLGGTGTVALDNGVYQLAQGISATGAGSGIINAGLFERGAAAGRTMIGAAFTNSGTVQVTQGALVFTNGFTNTGTVLSTEVISHGTVTITAAGRMPAIMPTAADFWPAPSGADTPATVVGAIVSAPVNPHSNWIAGIAPSHAIIMLSHLG